MIEITRKTIENLFIFAVTQRLLFTTEQSKLELVYEISLEVSGYKCMGEYGIYKVFAFFDVLLVVPFSFSFLLLFLFLVVVR